MTAAYFRAHIPAEWREDYVRLLARAQGAAEKISRDIRPVVWQTGNAERGTRNGP
jgi:hypothetical protein